MKLTCAALLFGLLGLSFGPPPSRSRQTEPPASQANSQDETDSVAAPVVIENWTKPQPGWLYVLDVRPDGGDTGGRVWLIDPETGEVMGSIRTSYHPDFALSPDGTRLFIASDPRMHATEIAVIDTTAGTVLGGQELKNRVEPRVLPPFSTMAVSRDGAILWVLTKPTDYSHLVAIDAATGEVLPGQPDVGHCEDGQFISYPDAHRVNFICPTMKKLHLIHVDEKGKAVDNTYGLMPWNHTLGVGEAFPSPRNDQMISIVRGDGAVFQMDVVSLSFYPTAAHGGSEHVSPGSWPVGPNDKVYLGYSHSPQAMPNSLADEFRVYNTSSWKKEGTIKTAFPFWSATLSKDGNRLYALAPQQHYLMVINTQSMKQLRTLDVGSMPALALVAP